MSQFPYLFVYISSKEFPFTKNVLILYHEEIVWAKATKVIRQKFK